MVQSLVLLHFSGTWFAQNQRRGEFCLQYTLLDDYLVPYLQDNWQTGRRIISRLQIKCNYYGNENKCTHETHLTSQSALLCALNAYFVDFFYNYEFYMYYRRLHFNYRTDKCVRSISRKQCQ